MIFLIPIRYWAETRLETESGPAAASLLPHPCGLAETGLPQPPVQPSRPVSFLAAWRRVRTEVTGCPAPRQVALTRPTPTPPVCARGYPGLLPLTRASKRLGWSSWEDFQPKATKIKS
jgi:hypothetical protein